MNNLIALLIRQALAACAGYFAANGIDGHSTTNILTGLIILAIPVVWSWAAKAIHLEDQSHTGWLSNTELLRVLVGSLVSQFVTAASVYFALDANNPELFGVAVVNAGLSKAGLHQKLAFIGNKSLLLPLLLSVCSVCSVVGCSSLTLSQRAAIAQSIVPLSEIGLSLAQSRGVIQEGDKVLIGQGVALVMSDGPSTRDKVIKLSALGVQVAVERGALQEGDALLIREATAVIQRALPSADSEGLKTITLEGPEPEAANP